MQNVARQRLEKENWNFVRKLGIIQECIYGVEGAGTGTGIAQNHESGRALAPALAHVGAVAALANGVQAVIVHEVADVLVFFTDWQLDTKPFRLAAAGFCWFSDW